MDAEGGRVFENLDIPFLASTFFYIQVDKIECKCKRSISEAQQLGERLTYYFDQAKLFQMQRNNAFQEIEDKRHLDCIY